MNFAKIKEKYRELSIIDKEHKELYMNELRLLLKHATDLEASREKYSKVLSQMENSTTKISELQARLNPTIYLSLAKHHRTKKPYIKAKSPWRNENNEIVFLWAYVGALNLFKNGLDDPKAKSIAAEKIRESIKEKYPLKG
jgi:hypothetical protein